MKKPKSNQEPYVEALKDPKFWIERLVSIIDKDSKKVPFIFNGVQDKFYKIVGEVLRALASGQKTGKVFDIILKARKMGFSTLIMALFICICSMRKNTNAVIVSHEDEATERLLKRAARMVEDCAFDLGAKVTKRGIEFPATNSMLWIGTAGSRKFGRGDDIVLAHLSEVGFYDDPSIITSVQEAMVNDAWCVMETTANGAGNAFHASWLRAVNKLSSWRNHFYGWFEDPQNRLSDNRPMELSKEEKDLKEEFGLDYGQLRWRLRKIADMDQPELFPQEHPATWEEAFLASGKSIFDWRAVKKMEDSRREPKWKGHIFDKGPGKLDIELDPKGPLEIYLNPEDKATYIIVCDTSEGVTGGAYSVADVYDVRSWEQVAQWRGYADPDEFKDIIASLGNFYNWATLAVEENHPGNAVNAGLKRIKYPNLHVELEGARPGEIGFWTTDKSKSQYITAGRRAVRDLDVKINSLWTINELRTFCLIPRVRTRKNNTGLVGEGFKMGPQGGCYQDTVITLCKACEILRRLDYNPEERRISHKANIKGKRFQRPVHRRSYNGSRVV